MLKILSTILGFFLALVVLVLGYFMFWLIVPILIFTGLWWAITGMLRGE